MIKQRSEKQGEEVIKSANERAGKILEASGTQLSAGGTHLPTGVFCRRFVRDGLFLSLLPF